MIISSCKYLNSDKVPNELNTRYLREDVLKDPYELYMELITYKKRMDIALSLNLFQYFKKIIYNLIDTTA